MTTSYIIGTNERITMRTPELYDTHSIDSRATVNQLAAANADKRCDYFFTYTCNQKDTLGVCHIWNWCESEEATTLIHNKHSAGHARNLSVTEMLMQILLYKPVSTSFTFVYIPTSPMGMRPILRMKSISQRIGAM